MGSWLSLLLVLGGAGLLGWLWLSALAPHLEATVGETAVLALLLGMVGWGYPLFLLAEFGLFSAVSVGLVLGVAVLLGLMLLLRQGGLANLSARLTGGVNGRLSLETAILTLWLLAACWLFLRPHQFIVGGADAGVYVNLAASLAESGRFLIDDPFLAALPDAAYAGLLRTLDDPNAPYLYLPGFYIEGEIAGRVTPQFYHLHPLWLGVVYSVGAVLGGAETAVFATLLLVGTWGILASLAVYFALRQMAGWRIAGLGLVGLSLCALQIWFARYPTTEMMTQCWLWLGLWGVTAWLSERQPRWLWALLGGLALGQVFLIRIDLFLMLPIFVALAGWLWLVGRWDKTAVYFFVPVALFFLHSLLHGYWQSRPYFLGVFSTGAAYLLLYWPILLAAGLGGLLLLWLLGQRRAWLLRQLVRWERPLRGLGIALLLAWGLYNWFIRPVTGEVTFWFDGFTQSELPDYNYQNLQRLGWYLSPVGVLVGLLGVAHWLWRLELKTVVSFAIGLFFLLFYVNNIRNSPHQIYAMRRYVPAVLPFLTVASALLLGWLGQQKAMWQRETAVLLGLLWLGGLGWSARGFVTQVDYGGMPEQLAAVDAQLEPNAVLLFAEPSQGDFFGTPLRFLYGHDVLAIRDEEALSPTALADLVQLWHNNGRSVYWIGDQRLLAEAGIAAGATQEFLLESSTLAVTYEEKPQGIRDNRWRLQIAELSAEE